MIRINFEDILEIRQHGLIQYCSFVIANKIQYYNDNKKAVYIYFDEIERFLVPSFLIKSIEHVKPTDL